MRLPRKKNLRWLAASSYTLAAPTLAWILGLAFSPVQLLLVLTSLGAGVVLYQRGVQAVLKEERTRAGIYQERLGETLHQADVDLIQEKARRLKAEGSFRALDKAVETMSLGVTVTDLLGRILYINPADARRQGLLPDELLGMEANWVLADAESQMSQSGALTMWIREKILDLDDLGISVRLISETVRDDQGIPVALVTLREDISHQRALEAALERRDRILRAVALAAERFVADPSWETSLEEVLEALAAATDTDKVRLLTDLSPEFIADLENRLPRQAAGFEITMTKNTPHWFFQPHLGTIQTGSSSGLSAHQRQALHLREAGSFVIVPIQDQGCLCLESRSEDRRWSGIEVDALRTAARLLGAAWQRQQAENILVVSEARYRELLETVSDPIASFSRQGHFTFINGAFSKTLGFRLPDLADRSLWEVVRPGSHRSLHELLHRLVQGETGDPIVLVAQTQDQAEVTFEAHISCRFLDGQPIDFQCIFRELGGRQAADRLKRQFVALVDHEFKTPLTSILGAARMLEQDSLIDQPKNRHRLLEILKRNSQRLERLVANLLDLQRLATDPMSYRLEPVEVLSSLEEAAVAQRPEIERRNLRLQLHNIPPGLQVIADRERLVQVFDQLLGNACKFSWEDSEVTASVRRQDTNWVMSIADQGPGVPPGLKRELFEGFTQVEGIDTRHREGAGIGLTLVKGLVEGMGGRIEIDTRPGEGTTVSVWLRGVHST